jgi:hypothetical protein
MASGQGGILAGATGRLALLIRRFANWLFQAEDARARQHGWQTAVGRGGMTRTYRDPRFNHFRRCSACDGNGTYPGGESCNKCAGTGRFTLTEQSLTDRGRSQ